MKFDRYERMPYEDTSRKRAAVKTKQRKERESAPLFAADIAATQPTIESEMIVRKNAFELNQQEWREYHAKSWKKARARLRTFPPDQQTIIRHLWNTAPYPASPCYLESMLHDIEVGRWPLNRPPWLITPEEAAEGRARLEAYWASKRTETI